MSERSGVLRLSCEFHFSVRLSHVLALVVLLKILSSCVSQAIHCRDKMRIFLEIHQTLCLWELQPLLDAKEWFCFEIELISYRIWASGVSDHLNFQHGNEMVPFVCGGLMARKRSGQTENVKNCVK